MTDEPSQQRSYSSCHSVPVQVFIVLHVVNDQYGIINSTLLSAHYLLSIPLLARHCRQVPLTLRICTLAV